MLAGRSERRGVSNTGVTFVHTSPELPRRPLLQERLGEEVHGLVRLLVVVHLRGVGRLDVDGRRIGRVHERLPKPRRGRLHRRRATAHRGLRTGAGILQSCVFKSVSALARPTAYPPPHQSGKNVPTPPLLNAKENLCGGSEPKGPPPGVAGQT